MNAGKFIFIGARAAMNPADYMHGATVFVDGGMTLYPGFEDNG